MGGETLLDIFKSVQSLAPIGQGFADRSASRYNAGVLRKQAGQSREAAAYDESAMRRNRTQIIAEQTASAIGDGGAGSSAMDVIRQNDVNLRLDELARRWRGEVEATGLRSQAAMVELEGDRALYSGLQGAGANLLKTSFERRAEERAKADAEERRRRLAMGDGGLGVN
jgi:hypothetical protein